MSVDTLTDSALLVEAKYAEFKVARDQLSEYLRAVHQWYQKPLLCQLFRQRDYPQLDDEVTRSVGKIDLVDALRQHPATYPLGAIWSNEQWTDKRFWYVFEHHIGRDQFVVGYPRQTITAQLSDENKPLIEVRGNQQDPLLHLPKGFRIPVYASYASSRRTVNRYAYWAPRLTDTPSTITIPSGAINRYRWTATLQEASTYRRTQVIQAPKF